MSHVRSAVSGDLLYHSPCHINVYYPVSEASLSSTYNTVGYFTFHVSAQLVLFSAQFGDHHPFVQMATTC